jgi:hypothetical protein
MTMNAGIWIDHRRAHIVGLNAGVPVATSILSNAEKHPERAGDSPLQGSFEARQVPADDHRQHALTGQLNLYYDAVIDSIRNYGKLLIIGPGEAKGELRARLIKAKQGDRIAAVEPADKMTDPQIVAKVQAYFGHVEPRSRYSTPV